MKSKPNWTLETVNHANFRAANKAVHNAEKLLMGMGMTLEEARYWVTLWASGAGDGSQ